MRNPSLDDGSRIELTTRTCVEMLVSQTKREAHLLQGEALFTIQHDDRKPFSVLTPHVAVDNLGTRFRVYEHEGETEVGVLQGEVGIRGLWTPHTSNGPPVRFGPGEGATVISTPNVVAIKPGSYLAGLWNAHWPGDKARWSSMATHSSMLCRNSTVTTAGN